MEKSKSKIWKYIVWFIAFVILLNIATRINWGFDKKSEKAVEIEKPKEVNNIKLYLVAQRAVKNNIKSPSTAKFPYSNEAVFVGGMTDSIYSVKCYVDSQNSYGVMIRSNFDAQLKYVGGDVDDWNNWHVIDVIIN